MTTAITFPAKMTLVHACTTVRARSTSSIDKISFSSSPCLKPNVELNVYLLKLPFGTIQFIGSMRPKFDV